MNGITKWWTRFGRTRCGRGRSLARPTRRMRLGRIARMPSSFKMAHRTMVGSLRRVAGAKVLRLRERGEEEAKSHRGFQSAVEKNFQGRSAEPQILDWFSPAKT